MAPKSPKLTAILLDFGGTLAFLDYELLATEFSRPGLRLSAEALEIAEYEGRHALDHYLMGQHERGPEAGARAYFGGWFAAAGIPAEEIDVCQARFEKLQRESNLWRVIRPGTGDALERLKSAGYRLAIVSNADGRVEEDARRFGLRGFFDATIDSHVVGVAKPSPRIFAIALERLGVSAAQARHVGDIYSIDVLGARAAGIDAALIDAMGRYGWVDHPKVRHIGEFDPQP